MIYKHPCPRCHGPGKVKVRNADGSCRAWCSWCGNSFETGRPVIPKHGKSGVIAGRIEIGRGAKWGASIV